MPLCLAPLFAVSLGLLLGLSAEATGATAWRGARKAVGWFTWLAFFPVVAFSSLGRPAWAILHFQLPFRLPSAVLLVGAAGAALLVPVAHEASAVLADRAPRVRLMLALLPATVAVLVMGALRHRSMVLLRPQGDAPAEPLFGSGWGLALITLDLLLVVALWLTATHLSREATESTAAPTLRRYPGGEHGSNG